MELGWGGFDRAKLDMLILIRIPFSFHMVFMQSPGPHILHAGTQTR